ncbi:MAG: hypothetical protein ACSHYA_00320 [Opitutaceae bacterium]
MDVNARISGAWRKRMLFMFFMIFGIGAWFLTDGYVYWPKEAARHAEFLEIEKTLIESGKIEAQEEKAHGDDVNEYLRIEWERYARENDYLKKIPKERTDSSIGEQRTIGWVMVAGSLLFLAWIAWNHTRKVTASGEIVVGIDGREVELDSIIRTDRKKWDNKGIAYAIYEDGGKERRLLLDDHKFEGCEAILLEAERRIKARKGITEEDDEDTADLKAQRANESSEASIEVNVSVKYKDRE